MKNIKRVTPILISDNDLFSVFLPTSKRQYCKINKHKNVGTYLYFYLNYDRNVAGTKEEIKIQKTPQPKC
jgi:hypothetical protein